MLFEIKEYKLSSGKTVRERLESEFPDGVWQCDGTTLEFIHKVSGLKRIYKWGLGEDGITALSASASKITPELNPHNATYEENRKKIKPIELEVYDYFNDLFAQDYWEEECSKRTSEKFNINEGQVHNIITRVSETLYL